MGLDGTDLPAYPCRQTRETAWSEPIKFDAMVRPVPGEPILRRGPGELTSGRVSMPMLLRPPEVPCEVAGELERPALAAETGPDLGPARLHVAAIGVGKVGLGGWITPARVVHADRACTVVTGNQCTVKVSEHLHVDRVVVSLQTAITAPVRRALGELIRNGFTTAGDRVFRRALQKSLIDRGAGPEELSLPLAEGHVGITTRTEVVQVGDRSRLNVETPIFVRETALPGAELLARDKSLREGFVAALRAPDLEGRQTATFLKQLMRAAGCTDQLRLVEHAAASGVHDASVFGLFRFTRVRQAGTVLAGAGNKLVRGVDADVDQFCDEDLAATMQQLRADFPVPRPPLGIRQPRRTRADAAGPILCPPLPAPQASPSSTSPSQVEPSPRRKRRSPGQPGSGESR